MKKKKILLISVLGLSALTAFGVFAGATSTKGFAKLLGTGEKVTWNHYSAVAPTADTKGIKEYWVSCSSHTHQFTAPTGDDIEVVDKGAPSQAFIDALEKNDDRLVAAYQKAITFEDNVLPAIFTANSNSNISVTNEAASEGNYSLKVTATGRNAKVSVDRAYLDAIFASVDEPEAILFDAKVSVETDMFYSSSATKNYGVYRYEVNGNSVNHQRRDGLRNQWKTFTFTKDRLDDLNTDNVMFWFDEETGAASLYIDNIRIGRNFNAASYVSYERNGLNKSGNDYSVQNNTTSAWELDGLVNGANLATVEITDVRSSDGPSSLHVVSGEGGSGLNVYASSAMYDAAKAQNTGILYDLYCASNDTMHIYGTDAVSPKPYINGDNTGKWLTVFIPNSALEKVGSYVRIFQTRAATFNFDLYFDNVRLANSTVGFENEKFLGECNASIRSYKTHPTEISTEHAHTGGKSLKITIAANGRSIIISDALYASLPEEGIKFYAYADTEFNGGVWHYFAPVGEWKEITVAKSAINATAGDHYIGTFWAAGTFYIDDVRPATAS